MNLLEQVQAMLEQQFGLAKEQISPEQLLSELGIESLSMIEFMFDLENAFDIQFMNDAPPPETVAGIVAAVEAAQKAKGG
ncbi:MAG: acyl carrier protein [Rhodocyclaceae bacterium]|nr:acyl carrier protein [Rhodocyclaceae bacterium]